MPKKVRSRVFTAGCPHTQADSSLSRLSPAPHKLTRPRVPGQKLGFPALTPVQSEVSKLLFWLSPCLGRSHEDAVESCVRSGKRKAESLRSFLMKGGNSWSSSPL